MAKEEKGLFSSLADSLSSLKLTIALLIILAVASIFGTVIPQNAGTEEYLKFYSVAIYRILYLLGFLDMYRSGWFIFLLGLFSLNIVACSLRRFRGIRRFFSRPETVLNEASWNALPVRRTFAVHAILPQCLPSCRDALARSIGRPREAEDSAATYLFAETQKFSRLGFYFIHLSILVILAGALIGSLFGFRGQVNIEEGRQADQIVLQGKGQVQTLGFAVRLDQFRVSFYPSGAPKEFKSTVTILDGNQKVFTQDLRVNHPLTYKGVALYQSSYGIAGVGKASLAVTDRGSGRVFEVPVEMGSRVEIPGTSILLMLVDFHPDFRGMGPALQFRIFAPNRSHENILIFQNHPELEAKRPGRFQYRVQDIQPRYYSGLQATKDPGVGLVWVGCLMIITGFSMILFLSHRRVWVRLTASGSNTRVEIAGSSHRSKLGFEKELEKMEDICKGMLPEAKINPQEGPA